MLGVSRKLTLFGYLPHTSVWCSPSSRFGNSYNNDERVLAAGYDNGDLKYFDLKSN